MNPPDRREFLAAVGATGSVLAAGCLGDGDGDEDSTPTPTPGLDDIDPVDSNYDLAVDHDIETWAAYDPDWEPPMEPPGSTSDYAVETVIENLEVPWDLEFADDGTLFVTERVGRISRYDSGEIETVAEPHDVIDHAGVVDVGESEGMDWWGGGSEGGLLGIALHPNYPDVPILYAAYTYDAGSGYQNRIVYYDVTDPGEETVVLDGIPGHELIHNGGRLTFGPRNYLWVTTGDANHREASQRTDSLAGSILRLEPDGTVPEDNPGFEEPLIYTYGHRNPQAISFLPDGTPIAAEHGDANRDEVHLLGPGENHGWPEAEDGGTYSGTSYDRPLVNTGAGEGWAPSGGVFYIGDAVESLSNRFLVGGLRSQRCNVVSVYPGSAPNIGGKRYDADWMHPDYDAVAHHLFEDDLGRIRHVEQAPDGDLFAITSNRDGRSDEFPQEGDDRLVRIVER